MSDLPDPLTPPDCDLRGYEFMPLYGNRLFSSDFDAKATDTEFRAAMMLWWQSWNQIPAASLPDDDAVLCKLAGLGRDRKTWAALRAGNVLHGFVKCNDGRLYHSMLADEAIERFALRLKNQKKRETDNIRLAEWRAKKAAKLAEKRVSENSETPDETAELQDETTCETRFNGQRNARETSKRGEERRREEKKEDIPPIIPPSAGQGFLVEPPRPDGREKKSRSRTVIPENWRPSPDGIALAAREGLPLERTIARFVAHHTAKGSLMASWNGAWATWCLSDYNQPKTGAGPPANSREAARAAERDANQARLDELLGEKPLAANDFFDGITIDGAAE